MFFFCFCRWRSGFFKFFVFIRRLSLLLVFRFFSFFEVWVFVCVFLCGWNFLQFFVQELLLLAGQRWGVRLFLRVRLGTRVQVVLYVRFAFFFALWLQRCFFGRLYFGVVCNQREFQRFLLRFLKGFFRFSKKGRFFLGQYLFFVVQGARVCIRERGCFQSVGFFFYLIYNGICLGLGVTEYQSCMGTGVLSFGFYFIFFYNTSYDQRMGLGIRVCFYVIIFYFF